MPLLGMCEDAPALDEDSKGPRSGPRSSRGSASSSSRAHGLRQRGQAPYYARG